MINFQQMYALWKVDEDLRYHFYLTLNIGKLTNKKRKINNFFIDMSRYVGRSPTQCKTHHQKKMQKHKNIHQLLYKFYEDFYTIRHLSFRQCLNEFSHHIGRMEQIRQHRYQQINKRIQQFVRGWKKVFTYFSMPIDMEQISEEQAEMEESSSQKYTPEEQIQRNESNRQEQISEEQAEMEESSSKKYTPEEYIQMNESNRQEQIFEEQAEMEELNSKKQSSLLQNIQIPQFFIFTTENQHELPFF